MSKINSKKYHLAEFFFNKYISGPMLQYISKTSITPNMITTTNFIVSFFTLYSAYKKEYTTVAFLMIFYQFCDNLDGNLARYKNLTSELGARLDKISDFIFYNLIFVCLGINNISVNLIILLVFLINFYGVIATYYIVPKMKKIKFMKRFGIKKFFYNKGFILGFDIGTMNIVSSIFLLCQYIKLMYIVLIILLLFDITYRIIEVHYNIYLDNLHL